MLDSHPKLAIPAETGFLCFGPTIRGIGDDLREDFLSAMVNFPVEEPNWPDFEIPEKLFRQNLNRIRPFNISDGYRSFYRLYAARFGKPRWGDKTPLHCKCLDAIRKVLPEARFIHLIRDGRDAALSLRKMRFSPGPEIETQAAYWRECVLAARNAGLNHPDYLEVRYEELILNTRKTLNQICRFIDLEYDDAMLRYYARTPVRLKEHKGRSDWLTQKQRISQQQRTTLPPDPACVFAWKSAMSLEEIERFQTVAGDLLGDLGYEVRDQAPVVNHLAK